jgi:aminoglycoside/choline kinase family phosphotransferase
MMNNDAEKRLAEAKLWLSSVYSDKKLVINQMTEDASPRRYYRVWVEGESFVLMDAPPEKNNNDKFVRNAAIFKEINVPQIYFKDEAKGFFILKDFGDETLFNRWNKNKDINDYKKTIIRLIELQAISQAGILTEYSEEILRLELSYFKDWYRDKYLNKQFSYAEEISWEQIATRIIDSNLAQKQVYVHRDYHSKNLMLYDDQVGVLDHQDALYGPITYDLASLLKDAYIELSNDERGELLDFYLENSHSNLTDETQFLREFDLIGLQRHLKIMGIFARLSIRDGKDEYLKYMPLVKKYILDTARRYDWLAPLIKLIEI